MSELSIRFRRDADIPALVEILERQQAETEYPLRWPWPGDLAQFIHRSTEVRAWVAEVDDHVAGHVALQSVADDELGEMWAQAHGVPISELLCISVLFADRRLARRGIGSALLARATHHAQAGGGALVLDVMAGHREAIDLYLRQSWVEVGRARPDWLPASEQPVHAMILPASQRPERTP